ncbi:cytochrome c [Gluconacetobacter sp. 1b LMG 1731]|uniref:Cytochrome c n=1 Tax=Gluconacetobacter dulcium TaxID=2729096 RepID=A0A7W4NRV4_9PROT|nr:cytochrome c [Gluconacetobacter dulcium]MBB2163887.1 cytochrome c [Gluconacetobacter dulcium]MBB2193213.1 cytochrome c [Gluconacetobacter dulcium]
MTARSRCVLRVVAAGLTATLSLSAYADSSREPAGYEPSVTAGRVRSGMALYAERCRPCHDNRAGNLDEAPPLAGRNFREKWSNRRDALYAKIKMSMPQDEPGVLSAAAVSDIVAALFAGHTAKADVAN